MPPVIRPNGSPGPSQTACAVYGRSYHTAHTVYNLKIGEMCACTLPRTALCFRTPGHAFLQAKLFSVSIEFLFIPVDKMIRQNLIPYRLVDAVIMAGRIIDMQFLISFNVRVRIGHG